MRITALTDSILEFTGNTPQPQLKREEILTKSEFLKPDGSINTTGIEHQIKIGLRQGGKERSKKTSARGFE